MASGRRCGRTAVNAASLDLVRPDQVVPAPPFPPSLSPCPSSSSLPPPLPPQFTRRRPAAAAMVSWNDGETSSEALSPLPHEDDDEPYRPATTEDRDWSGIDGSGKHLCNHGKSPERLVVFKGLNTGRRFYGCAEKKGYNCGVVEWVDSEWPYALKNSLTKLWALYEEAKAGRISDNLANEEKISKLAAEMKVVQEKYNKHIQLTKDFCESVEKSVHKENYRKIMLEKDEEKIAFEAAEKTIRLEKEL